MQGDYNAFKQCVLARCDEILKKDTTTQEISLEIVELEKKLQSSLNPEQKKIYFIIDELSIKQKEHEGNLLYVNGYWDGKNKLI